MMHQIITLFFIGLFAGFMSGMFDIGGGSVRIPLLNLAGLPLISAFGINLLVIPFSSTVGAITHRKNIEWKIGFYMVIGGTLGSVADALLVGLLPGLTLAIIFVLVSILTVTGIHLQKIAPDVYQKKDPKPWFIIAGAFLLNLITGMRGGSGGSLFPPFLRAMKLDIHKAIATSLFVTTFTAVAATIIYWHRGNIVWLLALSVLVGSIMGTRIGSKVSLKTKSKSLEIGLSVFVIILALIVVLKAI